MLLINTEYLHLSGHNHHIWLFQYLLNVNLCLGNLLDVSGLCFEVIKVQSSRLCTALKQVIIR